MREVPPPNFNDQFVKDLLNDEVKDLSQIKWKKHPLIKLTIDISGIILRDFFRFLKLVLN